MNTSLVVFYILGALATLGVSALALRWSMRRNTVVSMTILYALIFGSAYLFFAQYLKYASLHMYVDFAHWLQVLQGIVTKGWPEIVSHEIIRIGTLNYFSVHFVPLIYLLAIPFKLIPRPETIIVLNVALMLSAAIPLYKLAYRIQADKRFALFMCALLLWYPTFQYITMYEFEMLRFSIPVLLWMLYFWEKQSIKWYFLFVLAAILVREEVGLTVAMFGLYLVLFEKKRRIGAVTLIAGLVSFVVIFKELMPVFSNTSQFEHVGAGIAPQFGNTLTGVILGILRHPFAFLGTVLHPIKLANVGMLFLPLLFLPLAAPAALLGMVANIGIGLLSSSFIHSSYMLYYISPSIPFIFYAFIKAWPKITARFGTHSAMVAVLTGMIVANIFFGPSPISLQFWFKHIRPAPFKTQDFHYSAYVPNAHHSRLTPFIDLIPRHAIVSTQQFLAPRLFHTRGIMVFPQLKTKDGRYEAEYVLLDTTNNNLYSQSPAYITREEMAVVQSSQEWKLIVSEDGYELYKRSEEK